MVAGSKNDSEPTSPPEYTESFLEVPTEIHDAVCNFIIENFSAGLVLEEKENSNQIGIRFYVQRDDHDVDSVRKELARYINEIWPAGDFTRKDVVVKQIQRLDWEEAYRRSVKPTIVERVSIRPPWIEKPDEVLIDIVIEPKMAFGTGTHETTRRCLKEILKSFKPGQSMCDLGCGSGILSILAAKLGGRNIVGVDIDPLAVENARENIAINDVADKVKIFKGSLVAARGEAPFDFLAANIIKETILELLDDIFDIVKPGGTIILAGLLIEDKEAVEAALAKHGILKYNIKYDGEWFAVNMVKK